MGIKLPAYQSLNSEQLKVIEYDDEENLAVHGGPGTGKSILALYKMSHQNTDRALGLVYNNNLKEYLDQSTLAVKNQSETNAEFSVKTFDSFFGQFLKDNEPKINGEIQGDFHEKKTPIAKNLSEKNHYEDFLFKKKKHYVLIVDEAQDFSNEINLFLNKISKKSIIFADENQTINKPDSTSSRSDLNRIYKTVQNELFLTRNYRNTKQIYNFAKLFSRTSENTEDILERDEEDSKPQVFKCENFNSRINEIIKAVENNLDKTIGIFIPYDKSSDDWNIVDTICTKLEDIDKNRVSKRFGSKNDNSDKLDFSENSVHFLTFNTTKGLEYDLVIIPNACGSIFNQNDEVNFNKTYVAFTRARKRLYIYYDNNESSNKKSFLLDIINENNEMVNMNHVKDTYSKEDNKKDNNIFKYVDITEDDLPF